MYILFQIELPFWLNIKDKQIFKGTIDIKGNKSIYDLMINQDFWEISGVGEDHLLSKFENERNVINLNSLEVYSRLPHHLRKIDKQNEIHFSEDLGHFRKLKSVIQIFINHSGKNLNFSLYKLIFDKLIDQINLFLSAYSVTLSYVQNTNPHNFLLDEGYFNLKNTFIYTKKTKNDVFQNYVYTHLVLKDLTNIYYPNFELDSEAIQYIQQRLSSGKLRSDDTLQLWINNSKVIKDMRGYIINLIILLESKIEPILERIEKLHPELIKTLVRYDGVTNFLKFQLPILLNSKKYNSLIKSALELYDKRNLIIHKQAKAYWIESNLKLCHNTEKLIQAINDKIGYEQKSFNYQRHNILGTIRSIVIREDQYYVQLDPINNKTQELFYSYHNIKFNDEIIKWTIDFIKSNETITLQSKDFNIIKNENNLSIKIIDINKIFFCIIPPYNLNNFEHTIQGYFKELGNQDDKHKTHYLIFVFTGITKKLHDKMTSTKFRIMFDDSTIQEFEKSILLTIVNEKFKEVYEIFKDKAIIEQEKLIELLKPTSFNGDLFLLLVYYGINFEVIKKNSKTFYKLRQHNYEFLNEK